jgi:hypothetical protein
MRASRDTGADSFECSDAMVILSKGGEEAGQGAFTLLDSTAELAVGELRTGSGGLESKPLLSCIRSVNDEPSRIRATLASIRSLLIVSGDSSNSCSRSRSLDAL